MIRRLVQMAGRYRGELLLVAANYSTPLVGLYASTIAAMALAPREMGIVQAVFLLSNYASMLHMGAFHGLNRNLAFYMGRGDRGSAMRMVNASQLVARINAWVGVAIGSGLMLAVAFRGGSRVAMWSAAGLAGVLYCTPYATHISTTCRSGQHFGAMGVATLANNAARLIHALLPRFLNWAGYVLSMFLETLIRLILFKRVEPYPASRDVYRSDVVELLRVGFPIMIVGYVSSLVMVADQSMIALFLSPERLGAYTPARLVTVAIMTIPATLTILLSPKVAMRFGAAGTAASLRRSLWMVLWVHLTLLVPVCLAAFFLVGPVVARLLPQYADGIAPARVAALACVGLGGNGALIVTTTLRDNRPSLWIQGGSLALMWAAGSWLGWRGVLTIERAAWLRLAVAYASCTGLWIHAFQATRTSAPEEPPCAPFRADKDEMK